MGWIMAVTKHTNPIAGWGLAFKNSAVYGKNPVKMKRSIMRVHSDSGSIQCSSVFYNGKKAAKCNLETRWLG